MKCQERVKKEEELSDCLRPFLPLCSRAELHRTMSWRADITIKQAEKKGKRHKVEPGSTEIIQLVFLRIPDLPAFASLNAKRLSSVFHQFNYLNFSFAKAIRKICHLSRKGWLAISPSTVPRACTVVKIHTAIIGSSFRTI